MSNAKIRKAFETKLKSIQPPQEISYPNVNFSSANPYTIFDMLFARPDNKGYGNSPYIQRGYMQLSLQYPLGEGSGPAEARGELLRLAFFRGLSLTADGVTTTIDETPEVTGGAKEGDKFVVKVIVRFYAYIQ